MNVSVYYHSFNEHRADSSWENFAEDFAKAQSGEHIESGWRSPLENLTYEEILADEDAVINELKFLDLHYGSVYVNPTPESGKEEYYVHKAVVEAAGLTYNPDYQPKEDWLTIYSSIDESFVQKVQAIVMQDTGWEADEARKIIIEFLQHVRPIAKDLKDNPDSIFITDWETASELCPETAEQLLQERAKKNLQHFRDLIM